MGIYGHSCEKVVAVTVLSVKYGAIAAELPHQQDGVCCLIIDEVQERMIGIKYQFLYRYIP